MTKVDYPIITLTTDFGLEGPFIATMKGVILTINPQVTIVDVTHQIRTHRVREAAFLIRSVEPYFPRNSLHVVVVDPGVGSERRPLLVVTERSMLVGPDNGVLSPFFRDEGCRVYHITAEKFFLSPVSATFHGRDIFAPCAAWLSTGIKPVAVGPEVHDPVRLDLPIPHRVDDGAIRGEILYIDHFGNLITNISADLLRESNLPSPVVRLAQHRVRGGLRCYEECPPGSLGALINSWGLLEIFAPQQNAAKLLNVDVGEPVRVEAA
ncbi:MAG: SAM-dependent chlorinase/fluorinase [Candidatus Tectomicrobia bacterium]|nr:SAM-dependent chlorinase/fluorinase [Candidatus Tectomicrobia bacterium]